MRVSRLPQQSSGRLRAGLVALALAGPLSLAACGPTEMAVLAGANLVSIAQTDKHLGDHALSAARQEDCSIVAWSRGEPYCKSDAAELAAAADATPYGYSGAPGGPFCYRTLGRATCYREPDPMASEQARIR